MEMAHNVQVGVGVLFKGGGVGGKKGRKENHQGRPLQLRGSNSNGAYKGDDGL